MSDRFTANTITDDALDELYKRADEAEERLLGARDITPTLRRALDHLPPRCRYHGDSLRPDHLSYGHEACCYTGIPASRRQLAGEALAALIQLTGTRSS